MEEIYTAIKALSSTELKIKLAGVASLHEDIEKQNDKMDAEIQLIEQDWEPKYAPIYQAMEEIING